MIAATFTRCLEVLSLVMSLSTAVRRRLFRNLELLR